MNDEQREQAFDALDSRAYTRALAVFDQLIAQAPRDPELRYGRSLTLYGMGEDRQAQQEVRVLLELAPGAPHAHALSGRIAWSQSLHQHAQRSFERALELSQRSPAILVEYANFLAIERAPRLAEAVALECVRTVPEAPEAWTALGRVRMREHRYEEAHSAFERAIELDPNHPDAKAAMIHYLNVTGRDSAAAALTELLADDPDAEEFVEAQRLAQKHQAQKRALMEREEVRDEVLSPSLGERWWQGYRLILSIVVIVAIAGTILLMFTTGSPFIVGSTGALVLTFAMWRYSMAG